MFHLKLDNDVRKPPYWRLSYQFSLRTAALLTLVAALGFYGLRTIFVERSKVVVLSTDPDEFLYLSGKLVGQGEVRLSLAELLGHFGANARLKKGDETLVAKQMPYGLWFVNVECDAGLAIAHLEPRDPRSTIQVRKDRLPWTDTRSIRRGYRYSPSGLQCFKLSRHAASKEQQMTTSISFDRATKTIHATIADYPKFATKRTHLMIHAYEGSGVTGHFAMIDLIDIPHFENGEARFSREIDWRNAPQPFFISLEFVTIKRPTYTFNGPTSFPPRDPLVPLLSVPIMVE